MIFYFFRHKSRCSLLWLAAKFLRKRRWFFLFVVTTCVFDKGICANIAKQTNCRFFVFKTIVWNVAASSALQTFVAVFIILFPCMDINNVVVKNTFQDKKHLQYYYLKLISLSLQNYKFLGHTLRKTNMFILLREDSAPDT